MSRIEGAFSAIVLDPERSDRLPRPDGIRPLVLGEVEGNYVLASETCALDIVGATSRARAPARQMAILDGSGYRVEQAVPPRQHDSALCIFEFIYFARPDSRMDGQGLMAARVPHGGAPGVRGARRGRRRHLGAGLRHARGAGLRARSGLPFADGLVKNRYVGRTFIQPDQGLREHGLRLKFNPCRTSSAGGAWSWSTTPSCAAPRPARSSPCCRAAGAAEVHLRISSPPIVSPCYYGIDMAARGELLAARPLAGRDPAGARRRLAGVPVAGRPAGVHGLPADHFCRACLTGEYPTAVPDGGRDRQGAVRALAPAPPRPSVAEPSRTPAPGSRWRPPTRSWAPGGGRRVDAHARRRAEPRRLRGPLPAPAGATSCSSPARTPSARRSCCTATPAPSAPLASTASRCASTTSSARRAAALLPRLRRLRALDPERIAELVEGVAEGCRRAGCALLGGETAEIPALYGERDVDLAGFAVGAVERARLVDGARVADGDVLVGLASDGAHSNGFSLVRRLLEHHGIDLADAPAGLLAPTAIYAPEVAALVDAVDVRALAHVTGGGIEGNLPRVLPTACGAQVDAGAGLAERLHLLAGRRGADELRRVFNCGVGLTRRRAASRRRPPPIGAVAARRPGGVGDRHRRAGAA
jgi:hypothetical protein